MAKDVGIAYAPPKSFPIIGLAIFGTIVLIGCIAVKVGVQVLARAKNCTIV